MKKLNILLCYGAGMPSGFLARQVCGAARKQGIMAKVEAKSQNNIADNFPRTDILFIGPHLSYVFGELKAMCGPYTVLVLMVPKDMYAGLDGKGLLTLCMETLKGRGQSYEYIYQLTGLQFCTKDRKGHE